MDLSSGAVGAAEPKAIRALGKTVMADLGLYVWAPRGPASLSSLSQAAAIRPRPKQLCPSRHL